MPIVFGPAGLGGVKDAISNIEYYSKIGLKACEIAFTYGIYIKKKEDALKIGEAAKRFGVKLSIHAPYWLNLNSDDKKKIERSKERILKCCEVGTWLGVSNVVFHCGYYGENRMKAFENIKNKIIELQKEIQSKGYTPKLAPEVMGKLNVFGSIDEIYKLTEETKCGFCVDFAHILARYKDYKLKETLERFKKYKEIHVHFSGIEYGESGERYHRETKKEEWEKILSELSLFDRTSSTKNIVIINESPSPVKDSIEGLEIYRKIKRG